MTRLIVVADPRVNDGLNEPARAWHIHGTGDYEFPMMKQIRALGWPFLIGFDDNYWEADKSGRWDGQASQRTAHALPVFEKMLAWCDGVLVVSEPLAEIARCFNPNVWLVPSALPPLSQLPAPRDHEDSDGLVRIGWYGSLSHRPDAEILERPLRRLFASYPNVVVIFQEYVPELLRGHPQVASSPWVPVEQLHRRLADMRLDIFVAPAHPTPFNDARSHQKVLDACVLGLAFVASDFGPYRRTIEHRKTGWLVKDNSEESWYEALRTLVEEPALRRELGENGRRWVAESGTIETTGPLWAKALGLSL